MAFWRCFNHIVWATKDRMPVITAEMETEMFKIIGAKANEIGGLLLAANGMPDHVHLIVAIPPSISISDFVKNIKGTSSRFMHTRFQFPFAWQAGYGVFSVSPSPENLQKAINYVKFQKEHHASNDIYPMLEHYTVEDDGPKIAIPD